MSKLSDINLFRLNNNHQQNLYNSFTNNLNIIAFQIYNPIFAHYFTFYNNNSYKYFTFKSKYTLYNFSESIEPKNNDSYIKHIYKSKIRNNITKKIEDREIFIKINSILDNSQYIQNLYNINHNNGLPNIYHNLSNKKINDSNNTAYIDGFSSFILSKLVENNYCPSFPLYYGTFNGIIDNYKFDITEDYNSIKNISWFKKYNDNKFSIEMKDIYEFDNIVRDLLIRNNNLNTLNTMTLDNLSIETLSDDSDFKSNENSQPENNSDVESIWTDIESNSDIDSTISLESIENYKKIKYCNIKDYPVHMICMESFHDTLDNLLDNGYDMSAEEWKGILFQICFALSVAQKHYNFIHNDLHSSNIMFEETSCEFLYYSFKKRYFKIPTFNKISKIIDFGRATFIINKRVYFSDVFKKNGDAEGQYDYPYNGNFKYCRNRPNPSFDLARLATTISEHFSPDDDLYSLMEEWTKDDSNLILLNEPDDFDLYRKIAETVHNTIPKDQLEHDIFSEFIIDKSEIPKNETIYVF